MPWALIGDPCGRSARRCSGEHSTPLRAPLPGSPARLQPGARCCPQRDGRENRRRTPRDRQTWYDAQPPVCLVGYIAMSVAASLTWSRERNLSDVGVMHVVDTLDPGGLERVSVTFANELSRRNYRVHLCTTRREGPLADLVSSRVDRLCLGRRSRFDVLVVRRFVASIRRHEITLLHAHGTALFMAAIASLLVPRVKVIWHDHFGGHRIEKRPRALYWVAARRVSGIIAVTEELAEWSRRSLHVSPERVWCVPNFVIEPPTDDSPPTKLPGRAGLRIACVANIRPQKDHRNLVLAMRHVVDAVPEAHLLLLGAASDV